MQNHKSIRYEIPVEKSNAMNAEPIVVKLIVM